jgi:cyclohexanecarboxylate-CoA ligase
VPEGIDGPPGQRVPVRFAERTVWELVARRAADTPDGVMAIDEQRRSLTFAHYQERCEQVAAGLQALGVTAETHVAWQLPTCLDALVLFGALARLQAVQIPLVPLYRDREMSFVLGQTEASFVVVPGTWRGYNYAAMARRVAGSLTSPLTTVIIDHGLPEGDPASLAGAALSSTQRGQDPVRWIYYTSGSTSDPKGVLHSDGTLGTVAAILVDRLRMRGDDRIAMVFPFAHIGGSNLLLSALMVGCRCICVESFDPPATVDFLAEEGVTLAGAGTVFHSAYLAAQRRNPGRRIFPTVRAFPGGGAPKPAHLHDEIKAELGGAGIVSALGLTECQIVAMCDMDDPDDKLATTEGRPAPGAQVKVINPDEHLCGPNEEGELRLIAPQMFLGYVDAGLNAEAFDSDGYFRTGDLGFFDEDGYVHVVGRLKDVINRKGENISAKEIEDELYHHPDIREVAVIGLPDPASGERCCAVIVPSDPGKRLDMEGVQAFLDSRGLMRQKWPEQLEFVTELPRAPAGKVLKQELKNRFAPPTEVAGR